MASKSSKAVGNKPAEETKVTEVKNVLEAAAIRLDSDKSLDSTPIDDNRILVRIDRKYISGKNEIGRHAGHAVVKKTPLTSLPPQNIDLNKILASTPEKRYSGAPARKW
ncbi:MAG: hypothetical protein NT068_01355 [Candidatus Nomurabacteria bacterium]|nr:hypothetical protein [Candidatus Nomurabacteria bacterium]